MTANGNVNVNQAVVTSNGAVTLAATNGAINVAPGASMQAGTGAVALAARDTITTGPISGGSLTIASAAGSVAVNGLIDAGTGATRITAGADVNVNQSILNGQSGASLDVSAGRDVNLNAVIDGRGGIAGGAVTLDATRNVNLNESVLTKDGAIGLTAATGSVTVAAGKGTFAGMGRSRCSRQATSLSVRSSAVRWRRRPRPQWRSSTA